MTEQPQAATAAPVSPVRIWALGLIALASIGAALGTLVECTVRPLPPEATINQDLIAHVQATASWAEDYAVKHAHYPAAEGIVARIDRREAFGVYSWGPYVQDSALPLETASVPLVGAQALADGATPSAIGTVLGKGRLPTSPSYDARTYGAILYDVDNGRQSYVIYGVGRHGDQAVISTIKRGGFGKFREKVVAPPRKERTP